MRSGSATADREEPRPLVPEDLLQVRTITDPQVSPDGARVAFVVSRMDAEANQILSNVWLVPVDSSREALQVTFGPRRDSRPRWSPDGNRLAFLSSRQRDWADDLYVLGVTGGEARRLAALPRGILDYAWAPDGRELALLGRPEYPVDPDRPAAKDEAERRRHHLERAVFVDKFRFRFDGLGLLDQEARQVWICDHDGGELRPVTDGPWETSRPRWNPTGTITFLSNRGPDHEQSDVTEVLEVMPGRPPVQISSNQLWVHSFAFSPDGQLAVLGVPDPDASGDGLNANLYIDGVCQTTGLGRTATNVVFSDLAPPGDFNDPCWSADGRSVYFQVSDAGRVHLHRQPIGGASEAVLGGDRLITAYSLGGQTLAFISTSPDDPVSLRAAHTDGSGEFVLFDPNSWVRGRTLSRLAQLEVGVGDRPVDGWKMLPPGYEGGQMPTVLLIHGGPHAAYGHAFQFNFNVLAGAGYAVVCCNPPGSQSYEEEFATAIHGRCGELDLPYYMAVLDAAIQEGFADPERLGVGGTSYGGYASVADHAHESFPGCSCRQPGRRVPLVVRRERHGMALRCQGASGRTLAGSRRLLAVVTCHIPRARHNPTSPVCRDSRSADASGTGLQRLRSAAQAGQAL